MFSARQTSEKLRGCARHIVEGFVDAHWASVADSLRSMTADVLTKSLQGPNFIEHREVLHGNALPTAARALRAATSLLS